MTKTVERSDVAAAWQEIARCEAGQLVIDWLLQKYGFTRSTIFSSDPLQMARQAGQHDVVREVGVLLDTDIAQLKEIERGSNQLRDPFRLDGSAGASVGRPDHLADPDE